MPFQLMAMPRMTSTAMKGILFSLLRRRNRPTMQMIVRRRVMILKDLKVWTMMVRGLVKALEFEAAKKPSMFYIERGKNCIY